MKPYLLLLGLLVPVAGAQVSSTRITSYDWQCQNEDGSRVSDHQREGTAITACINDAIAKKDGKARIVAGGRYRITYTPPVTTPPVTPTPEPTPTTRLTWTPPTTNTDGSSLTNLTGYRIEALSGSTWTAVTTVGPGVTSYDAPGATGTWRIVALSGTGQSAPTNQISR